MRRSLLHAILHSIPYLLVYFQCLCVHFWAFYIKISKANFTNLLFAIREVRYFRLNRSRQNRKEALVQYHLVEDVDLLRSRLEEEEDYWLSLKSGKMVRRAREKPGLF